MLFEEDHNLSCQISKFHELLEPSKISQSILLPDFYETSESLIFSFVSSILKKPVSSFENIDVFHLKPNENGNILMEDVKLAISFALKTPIISEYKFILVHKTCELSINASNALLKILEEPTKKTFFLMFYSNKKAILPTIRSRCIVIDFAKTEENFKFIVLNSKINPENIEIIKEITGCDFNKIKYFKEIDIKAVQIEFENLIKNHSFVNFKKFISKYSEIKNFQTIIFLLIERQFYLQIKLSHNSQALIKKYFSFLLRKKYVKLYNTNFDLTLCCTINDLCAEAL